MKHGSGRLLIIMSPLVIPTPGAPLRGKCGKICYGRCGDPSSIIPDAGCEIATGSVQPTPCLPFVVSAVVRLAQFQYNKILYKERWIHAPTVGTSSPPAYCDTISYDIYALCCCRASLRFELTRLHRVSVGPIVLGDVKEGCCRELTRKEVVALYKRCLPEDPLCPTVAAVEEILSSRLAHTANRLREAAGLVVCKSNATRNNPTSATVDLKATPTECVPEGLKGPTEERRAVGMDGAEEGCLAHIKAKASGSSGGVAKAFASAEDLAGIVRLLIDLARRDLHETPPGPAGESTSTSGPEFCPGEKESLAQARAIPPNEDHMLCGYRCSQIERLGLKYSVA